jgi:hypothetical protein
MDTRVEVDVIEVLVTGIPFAGKSSFLQTLNPNLTHHDGWQLVDIALDSNLHMRFVEPPSRDDFDYLWVREVISSAEVDGFVIVCDSTRPELFGEMIGVLQTVLSIHEYAACVVVANKQDDPNAWSAEDIRFAMNIPMDIPVLPCVAVDIAYVRDAVVELLYQILRE